MVRWSVCLFVCLSVCLFVCLSGCLAVWLSVWLAGWLSVCLSVCGLGIRLLFSPSLVRQDRNVHNYLADFDSESDLYLRSFRLLEQLRDWQPTEDAIKAPHPLGHHQSQSSITTTNIHNIPSDSPLNPSISPHLTPSINFPLSISLCQFSSINFPLSNHVTAIICLQLRAWKNYGS